MPAGLQPFPLVPPLFAARAEHSHVRALPHLSASRRAGPVAVCILAAIGAENVSKLWIEHDATPTIAEYDGLALMDDARGHK